ncbi:MAG: hypothetical protein R3F41_11385 [Gammaproteobacteria bacterium]|nr:hypothetical protein [Pseudomonadales bacterium]MCP5348213.1 hypothetical protein [Pseudomonadales bacterium]
MKSLLIVAGIMSLVVLSPNASADGRHRGGYAGNSGFGHFQADRHRGWGYSRGYVPRRHVSSYRAPYYQPYWGGGSYWNFSVGSRYGRRHDHFDTGALLGGIVLGSVIGQGIASSRYENRVESYAPPPSQVTVIRRTPVTVATPPARRLLRDLSGRCYEIYRDGAGTESRVELDPSACNF